MGSWKRKESSRNKEGTKGVGWVYGCREMVVDWREGESR